MPDFFGTHTKFTIVNDVLYDALKDYVRNELHRNRIGVRHFIDESDSIGYRELSFDYSFGDDWIECQPESLYDVLPCFLIFLGATLEWRPGQFAAFRRAILEKRSDIENHFVRVSWETDSYTYRPDYDGTYGTEEAFSYDMAEDVAKHHKTTFRWCDDDYKEHSRYHGYEWGRLDAGQGY